MEGRRDSGTVGQCARTREGTAPRPVFRGQAWRGARAGGTGSLEDETGANSPQMGRSRLLEGKGASGGVLSCTEATWPHFVTVKCVILGGRCVPATRLRERAWRVLWGKRICLSSSFSTHLALWGVGGRSLSSVCAGTQNITVRNVSS